MMNLFGIVLNDGLICCVVLKDGDGCGCLSFYLGV